MGKDEKVCWPRGRQSRGALRPSILRPRHPLPIGSVNTNTTTMKTVLALALMSLGAVTAWVPLHVRLPRTVARAGRSTTSVSMAVEGTEQPTQRGGTRLRYRPTALRARPNPPRRLRAFVSSLTRGRR